MLLNIISRQIPVSQQSLCVLKASKNIVAFQVRDLSLYSFLKCSKQTSKPLEVEPNKDRTNIIPVETSIKYLNSSAYASAYGSEPVWKQYRRNHKGLIPPRKTRKTCIRKGLISSGNPCPLCRDEYLVPHPDNVELLKQFISPHTGEILSYSVTGVCQKKHNEVLVAIETAKDQGLLTFDVPFRSYNYSLYKPQFK